MNCLTSLSAFILYQALLLGICEGYDASDLVIDLQTDELVDAALYLCDDVLDTKLFKNFYWYHNTQVSADVEHDSCADSCSPPRFIPTYAHPKTERMCIFAHYDENSLTCTNFIRESTVDSDAAQLQRKQGCDDKTNGTLIVRKYYHFLAVEDDNMQEVGKLGPLTIGAIDRRVEVSGTPVQYSHLFRKTPLLFRSRVAAPAEEFTNAVQDLPSCQEGSDCRGKQDQINIDLIETFNTEVYLEFTTQFQRFEFGSDLVDFYRPNFDSNSADFIWNNGTGILWSEFYRNGFKQLIDDTMTSEQGQVECNVNEDTCGSDDEQLKLKATSGALRYQLPSRLRIDTMTINEGPGRRFSYDFRMSSEGPASGLRRSIPYLLNNEETDFNGDKPKLAKDIDPRISNGNKVEQKTCELMVAESKKKGGAPLDDIYAALCDYRMGNFGWGEIIADLTLKIDSATCKFPDSIDFTDDDLIGPAHDVKYACLYNKPPSLVWPIVGGVAGALLLITLGCMIKKNILCIYEKEGKTNINVHSASGSMATDAEKELKTVSSNNPRFEL